MTKNELIEVHGGDVKATLEVLDANKDGLVSANEWLGFLHRMKAHRGDKVSHTCIEQLITLTHCARCTGTRPTAWYFAPKLSSGQITQPGTSQPCTANALHTTKVTAEAHANCFTSALPKASGIFHTPLSCPIRICAHRSCHLEGQTLLRKSCCTRSDRTSASFSQSMLRSVHAVWQQPQGVAGGVAARAVGARGCG